jgi:hypothetical protein
MTTAFKDDFIERIEARVRAEVLNDEFINRIEARVRAEVLNDEFINRIKAEGRAEALKDIDRIKAEGEAGMLLRVLAARGFEVAEPVRERVLSCTDLSQLESWADRAVTAVSIEEVFPG